jgi:hypothetical protein
MSKESLLFGGYCIETLKANNWMPWKHCMLTVYLDLGLDSYINGMEKCLQSANLADVPSKELIASQVEWDRKDTKACCQIELVLSNAEMIHVIGAITAQ